MENRIETLVRNRRGAPQDQWANGELGREGGLAAVAAIEAVETAFAGFTAEPAAAECGQTVFMLVFVLCCFCCHDLGEGFQVEKERKLTKQSDNPCPSSPLVEVVAALVGSTSVHEKIISTSSLLIFTKSARNRPLDAFSWGKILKKKNGKRTGC